MKKSILERVTVGFRCPMNWEEMAGDGREKFCSKCEKSVTDFSQLTSEEAEAFVEKTAPLGKACIRLTRDEEGQLVTKGCGSPAMVGRKAAQKLAVGAAAAGSLAMAACSSSKEEQYQLMGIIHCPSDEK